MDAGSRAYLTIVRWPEGLGEADKVRALADATGMDEPIARQNARHAAPRVVMRVDAAPAEGMIAKLAGAGAVAFAPTHAQIAPLLQPSRAKHMVRVAVSGEPEFEVGLWRGPAIRLKAADICLIVRAHVRAARLKTEVEAQLSTGLHGAETVWQPVSRKNLTVMEVLDIHTSGGQAIRITADKFNFDVLGGRPALTETENLDRLAALLASLAPRAIVDKGFAQFHPGVGFSLGKAAGGAATGSGTSWDGTRLEPGLPPTFEFYSAWMSLVNRFTPG